MRVIRYCAISVLARRITLLLVIYSGTFLDTVGSQTRANGRPGRIGRVFIVGNEVTQDRVIREVLHLNPGQPLRFTEVRLAERNLSRLGIFALDENQGVRPTVSILDGAGDFKDILVQVKETRTWSLWVRPYFKPRVGLVLGLVLEERNFDPWQLPTRLDDLLQGRAFRGAGQKLSMELASIPVVTCCLAGFHGLNGLIHPSWELRLLGEPVPE